MGEGLSRDPLGPASLHGVREHPSIAIPAVTLDTPVTWASAEIEAGDCSNQGLRSCELKAQYPQDCKALRILIRAGATLAKVKRTVSRRRRNQPSRRH